MDENTPGKIYDVCATSRIQQHVPDTAATAGSAAAVRAYIYLCL